MTHQSYGPKVAVPRLLQILQRQDIRATFFVPGFTAGCYPDTVRRIVDAGHEVAHHGYLHEPMQGIDAGTEARYIGRGLEALAKVGVEPVGYRQRSHRRPGQHRGCPSEATTRSTSATSG
ncbi:peptidoglycan/xylan/chitin deacetylase (PgdA/CDA1 family) [Arthrobacter sp. UYEF6]